MISNRQEPQRSRVAAGICYVAVGGVICTAALLLMRSGISTISTIRDGEIPIEMIAGIAGILVFMGFVQLVIAFILMVRDRRRSHLVQPHLTNR